MYLLLMTGQKWAGVSTFQPLGDGAHTEVTLLSHLGSFSFNLWKREANMEDYTVYAANAFASVNAGGILR